MPSPSARQIFEEYLARIRSGTESVSFEELIETNPEHDEELRSLWAKQVTRAEQWIDGALESAEPRDAGETSGPTSAGAAPRPGPAGSTTRTAELLARLSARPRTTDRFEPRGEIARGGMGRILEVYDADLRRALALKTLQPPRDDAGRDAALGRFLEEAQVTAQLEHPGIPPVHELGLGEDGQPYFAMPKVAGRDLREIYGLVSRSEENWSRTRALGVLQRVAETMAYAHSRRVIHRDLKPGNVMVGAFGEVYVMDWGLAKVLGAGPEPDAADEDPDTTVLTERAADANPDSGLLTQEGSVLGTPSYMAPEQAEGRVQELGTATDVYALGAMLYHLLTDGPPFVPPGTSRSSVEVLLALRQGPPEPLSELAPDAPAELVAICEKAMAREPDERYPDMGALAADLRAYLEGRVVAAHSTGAWVELRKWVRRNRATASALAAVLLAVLVGAWTVTAVQAAEREKVARERDRVLGLSDVKIVRELREEEPRIWPPVPGVARRMSDWLGRAEAVLANADLHRENLATVEEATVEAAGGFEGAAGLAFATQAEAWEHLTLTQLLGDLAALQPEVDAVRERREFADAVQERTVTGSDARERWTAAIEDVADLPVYAGLPLEPIVGLLPLRRDPSSGLWEFWHVYSGREPMPELEGGYALEPETGIVLVLLPGTASAVGSREVSPEQPDGEPYVDRYRDAEVDRDEVLEDAVLEPFFIAKYELTQAQFLRVMSANPSAAQGPGFERHPVEQVSWLEARTACRRLGLELPTEAQWEVACRGGTTTPFPTGPREATLVGAANFADRQLIESGQDLAGHGTPQVDDGYAGHAPVGTYRPNDFGLHDMIGNVWEWCLNDHVLTTAVDARYTGNDSGALRGGGFTSHWSELRSANRLAWSRSSRDGDVGLRPVLGLGALPD